MKRQLSALLAASMLLGGLTGCGANNAAEEGVPVQTVASILGYDLSGNNRFSGVVESRATQKIKKDEEKQVDEIKVKVGDEVKKGDVLFTYDQEALQLSLETAQLELEQIQNNITSYQTQINELTKEKKKAASSEKLSYSIQIQEAQLSISEEQYNQKKKESELKKLQEDLAHAEVVAEVNGMVQSIQDGSSTDYGSTDDTFMTILETGVLQVKGTASEMNIYELFEGQQMTIRSRVDENQVWTGEITKINTDGAEEDSNEDDYDDGTGGESASKYSFIVTLTSSDGLMMGQHVYIEQGAAESAGIQLGSFYIVQEEGNAYVWAADGNDKLEKRAVTLGEYDEEMDTYEIVDGLTLEDKIAFPEEGLQEGDSVTLFDDSAYSEDGSYEEPMDEGFEDGSILDDSGYPEEGAADGGEEV